MFAMETRLTRVRAGLGPRAAEITNRSISDWYGGSCSCGLAPGECRQHHRARVSQRPPEGDWRVWAYVAGRGAGKTRAGACWTQHRALSGIMKEAFQTYSRQRRGGEWINDPADSHPEEDLIDTLRGGIRDAFPDGLAPRPSFTPVHASRLLG